MLDKSVGVIPLTKDEKGNVLCLAVQHVDKHWGVPKGHPDTGETFEQSRKRELFEETGLSWKKIFTEPIFTEAYSFEKDGKMINKEVYYCLGILDKTDPVIPDEFSHEILQAVWMSFDELINLVEQEDAKVFVNTLKRYIVEHEKELFEL